MRKLLYFLIGLMSILSCEKDKPEFEFRIKSTGFFLEDAFLHSGDSFPSYTHKLSGGNVSFIGENSSYEFRTGNISIEEFPFRLPAGRYQVEFQIDEASRFGQKGGSFLAERTSITVTEVMDQEITVPVAANCALFLVDDERNQLDKGIYMIQRYASGYFESYPLTLDSISGMYYAYFTPDTPNSNTSAFLWFYEGNPGIASGGLSTLDFEKGYQYLIEVLD